MRALVAPAQTVCAPITSDVLRRIPLGQIVARAQAELADQSWKEEGVAILGRSQAAGSELARASVQALEKREHARTAGSARAATA